MRISHYEALQPVCPRCRIERQHISPLNLECIETQIDDIVIDGYLKCTNNECRLEYPIIDGIPIIVNQIRKYINDNFYAITVRNDLSPATQSILGDLAGPESAFNSMRHYISTYAWDHYGDKAHTNEFAPQQNSKPGSIVECLDAGMSLIEGNLLAPAIDIGCAVGRSTFEISSHCNGLALGIDLNFSLLRLAQNLLTKDLVKFPIKKTGVVYNYVEYPVYFDNKENVDFWACDGVALPFNDASFGFACALNVIDAVNTPRMLLRSIEDALKTSGCMVLATPYDWTPPVPVQNWIGGHSQHGPDKGSSEAILRKILTSGASPQSLNHMTLIGEIENHAWQVRVHDRRTINYDTHIVAARKSD